MGVVLVGYQGAGKSCVGRHLARALDLPFQDCDDLLGEAPAILYQTLGEEEFRQRETEALAALKGFKGVVATGGGVVERSENLALLKSLGAIVYLHAELATLKERGNRIFDPKREKLYKQWANEKVVTDGKGITEVMMEVALYVVK